jgi:hypothetical protein
MRLVDTVEGPADPVGELVSAEQSLREVTGAEGVEPSVEVFQGGSGSDE